MDEDVSAIRDYGVTCGVEEVSVSSLTNLARLLKLELEHPNWATPRQGESNVRTYQSWSSPHFAKYSSEANASPSPSSQERISRSGEVASSRRVNLRPRD